MYLTAGSNQWHICLARARCSLGNALISLSITLQSEAVNVIQCIYRCLSDQRKAACERYNENTSARMKAPSFSLRSRFGKECAHQESRCSPSHALSPPQSRRRRRSARIEALTPARAPSDRQANANSIALYQLIPCPSAPASGQIENIKRTDTRTGIAPTA